MAKALFGHVGAPAGDAAYQTMVLRRRIADLEAEVRRLKSENDGLLHTLSAHVDHVTAGDLLEPLAR